LRKYSYQRFSEARAAHWLLLVAADRLDAAGSHVRSLLTLRPDPIATGLRSEVSSHGFGSRVGRRRTDLKHQWLDPIIVLSPWIATATAGYTIGKRVRRR
jgi:hypothetical protein